MQVLFNEKYPNLAKKEFENAKVPTLTEIIETFGHNANYYIETKHLMNIQEWKKNY